MSLRFERSWLVVVLTVGVFMGVASGQPVRPDAASGDDGGEGVREAKVAEARRQMRRALQLLEDNRVEGAVRQLRALASQSDDAGTQYLAGLVGAQIAGRFAERQAAWRESAVIDAVVLVPDARSFYAAVARWRGGPMFPVLIEDGWWAPMFIRAFEPARVVRWRGPSAAAGEGPSAGGDALDALLDAHEEALDDRGGEAPAPPGLVVLDGDHAHAAAGAALAVGRRQRVLRHEPDPKALKSVDGVSALNGKVMRHAARHGLVAKDAWFGITLAGDYPMKVKREKETLAFDDLLGRDSRGLRLAVAGRLHGSARQAVYQAMCGLFLQPERALLVDDYSNREGGVFPRYRFDEAAAILDRRLAVTHLTGDRASAGQLRRLRDGAGPFGMTWINSSGGARSFALRGAAGEPTDLPVGHPGVYYVVHSFSAQRIGDPETIAGRALYNGAYWYFGSVHEPYLHAFVRPTGLAVKAMAGTPLAVAARHTPGHPMHRPWKLAVVGDPLFTLRDEPAKRVEGGLPEGVVEVAVNAEDPPADRFRAALLSGAEVGAELATAALRGAGELPIGDLRSAAWALARAGRVDVIAAHVDAKRARGEPVIEDALARGAAERFGASREAGDIEGAEKALVAMLRWSDDRRRLTEAVRGLVAEASKRDRDAALVERLRRLARERAVSRHGRRAIREALPEPAE